MKPSMEPVKVFLSSLLTSSSITRSSDSISSGSHQLTNSLRLTWTSLFVSDSVFVNKKVQICMISSRQKYYPAPLKSLLDKDGCVLVTIGQREVGPVVWQ